ncbi:ergosterol biosynthesis protein [Tulasnella sp. UAMH 9824]|nr:ergosterol biosynthesis protein [Tulasnella sp. UAMH 9824]
MASLAQYLPEGEGWLPRWQLFVASLAIANSIQNLFTVNITKRLYTKKPGEVTALQARMSTMWNFTSAIVRLHCAYNIHNKASVPPSSVFQVRIYNTTLWTYAIAFFHFSTELLFFGTAKLNGPVISPVIVSSVSLLWMLSQYDFYVK